MSKINEYLRGERNPAVLEDIIDGEVYKNFIQKGLLGHKNQLSVTVSIDGVSPFEDSDITLWPIWLVFNEVPPDLRYKNIYLLGLYFNDQKPSEEIMLKPLVDDLLVAEKGVNINGITYTVILTSLICDLQAKCTLLKLKGPTGFYCCANCRIKGITHPLGRNRAFIGCGKLRDRASWLEDGANQKFGIDGKFI